MHTRRICRLETFIPGTLCNMPCIKLNKNMITLVDDDVFEYLNQWRWSCSKNYVIRHGLENGKYKTIYMHRVVNCTPDGYDTDHINGDKLDNRKCNLRAVTKSQNNCNKSKQSNNTSGYKGVSWHKGSNSWQSYIKINGKVRFLGYFKEREDAAKAYNSASNQIHGKYGRFNVVDGGVL